VVSSTYANDFRIKKKITLKKDEQKKILVKYGTSERLFKFRWTLYKNSGLVIHRSYDQIIAQNILYKENKHRYFRLELKSKGSDFYDTPYFLVKFKEFDFKTKEAVFMLLLSDRKEQIELEFLN